MKTYNVTTIFTFTGTFIVKAQNKEEAKKHVQEDCGLVIGGNIHSSLLDEDIDWNFPTHATKVIRKISR